MSMFSLLAALALPLFPSVLDSTAVKTANAPLVAGLQAGPMILGSSSNAAHHLGNTGYAADFALRSMVVSSFEIEFKGTSGNIVQDNGALDAIQTEVRAASVMINWIPTLSLFQWGEDEATGIDRLDTRRQRTELKPFFGIGIGHSDLHRSVDALDQQGRAYHMWNDGSLRSFDEFSEQAAHAVLLERDFNYETDYVEDQNANSSRSAITLPMQAGVQLDLGGPVRARVGASGWIGSDASGNSTRMIQGFFGLDYSIGASLARAVKTRRSHRSKAAETSDWDLDQDGVSDLIDRCPGTPYDIDVKVGLYGCPVDSDGDGYADYRDDEPLSVSVAVNARGVGLTSRQVNDRYLMWTGNAPWTGLDSDTVWTSSESGSGDLAAAPLVKVGNNSELTSAELNALMKFRRLVTHNDEIFAEAVNEVAAGEALYRVQVGAFATTQAEDLKSVFAGWETLALHGDDGMTRYVSRAFSDRAAAEAHRDALALAGFEGVFIASYGAAD